MQYIDKQYTGECDWNIGSLFCHDYLLIGFLKRINDKGYGIKNLKYAFGSPLCFFGGGRVPPSGNIHISEVKRVLDEYIALGIGCRLTFQNPKIEKGQLWDVYSNQLLTALAENNPLKKNGVIVYSENLLEHIKENYPELETIASIVKPSIDVGLGNDTFEYYNELMNRYDLVVVNSETALDETQAKGLANINKCEVIANSQCIGNCPLAKTHYELISEYTSEISKHNDSREAFELKLKITNIENTCNINKNANPFSISMLSEKQINRLIGLGFKHFKLEGRQLCESSFFSDFGRYVCEPNMFHKAFNRNIC